MGIRNDKLGGTDWGEEALKPTTDLTSTFDAVINNQGISDAELAVRIFQANDIFINGVNFVVDEMGDSTGTKNTINTSSSTAKYDSTSNYYTLSINDEASGDTTHDPDSFTNASNAFDSDDSTYAQKTASVGAATYELGKTFGAKTVNAVYVKCAGRDAASQTWTMILQTYNGSVWSDHTTLYSGADTSLTTVQRVIEIGSSIQGVRVEFDFPGATTNTVDARLYSLEYGDYDSSATLIADTSTATLDGNELGFAVSVPDSSFPTDTSISVVISDGSNSLGSASINSASKGVVAGNPGTLTAGTLKLTFTLATSDTSAAPTISSYGVKINR